MLQFFYPRDTFGYEMSIWGKDFHSVEDTGLGGGNDFTSTNESLKSDGLVMPGGLFYKHICRQQMRLGCCKNPARQVWN